MHLYPRLWAISMKPINDMVQDYAMGDELGIVGLQNDVLDSLRTIDHWKWKRQNNSQDNDYCC